MTASAGQAVEAVLLPGGMATRRRWRVTKAASGVRARVFSRASTGVPGFESAWTGALALTLQLYFDFSAYSDMAIGVAMMMGLRLPDNLNSPYQSRNLQHKPTRSPIYPSDPTSEVFHSLRA
jgi:alginate O-acetyltransferase complex protein AlgI